MQPQRTIGEALVDVYDSIVTLVRTELRLLTRKIGKVLKAKGLGLVLLLAALGPLLLFVIFLVLALFYGLIDLGMTAWGSALVVAAIGLVLAVILIAVGMKQLSKEVKADEDPQEAARKNAEAARKNLEQAEKREDKAEQKYETAQRDLARQEGHRVPSGTAPAEPAVSHPQDFAGKREERFTGDLNTPDAVRREKDEAGHPVSTKPTHEEEERR